MASDAKNPTYFNNYSQQKYSQKLSYWVLVFWVNFLNIAKMLTKPFSLRSGVTPHIKYAKQMKKFDREGILSQK